MFMTMNHINRSLLSILFLAGAAHALAGDKIVCNFQRGIPADFILVDNDGNEPSASAQKLGFNKGDAWIAWNEDATNKVAASTSWYKPAGQSDDWMILPSLDVKKGTVLKWRTKAVDAKYRDGYAIYVSTTGTDLDCFDTAQPVFSVDAEESEWTTHSISLEPFAGKSIHIAFVNNSNNKSRLYLDDLFAGVPQAVSITPASPYVVKPGEKFVLSATVSTDLDEPQQGVSVSYQWGEHHESITLPTALATGEPQTITFSDSLEIASAGDSITPIFSAGETEASQCITAHYKRILCEEATGMWCGYCVNGIVTMDRLKKAYPNEFIGISIHSGDKLDLDGYSAEHVGAGNDGYPDMIGNRLSAYHAFPVKFEPKFQKALQDPIGAAVELKASIGEDGKVNVLTTTCYNTSADAANYALAYVLVEDSVHHPDDGSYRQHNSYAGGSEGEMGGFENLPEYVPASEMYYMDVPRLLEGGYEGLDLSQPSGIDAGTQYTHQYAFDVPETVDHINQCSVVAMLLDRSSGAVINAASTHLASTADAIDRITGSDKLYSSILVYDLQGRRRMVLSEESNLNAQLQQLLPGVYIIRNASGHTRKHLIR